MSRVLDYQTPPAASLPILTVARAGAILVGAANVAAVALIALRHPAGVSALVLTPAFACFVVIGSALLFVALHRRTAQHPGTFAAAVLLACAAEALLLLALIFLAPAGLLRGALAGVLIALTGVAALLAGLVAYRPETERILLQSAHRAFSVAVWVLAGRVVLAFWLTSGSGSLGDIRAKLLPLAFGLFAWSALVPLGLVWLRPVSAEAREEARPLTRAAAVLLIPTLAWLVISTRF
jgi:hypothetical protein